MHHIICDGISNGILMRDMVVYYESLLKGTEPRLPELPIQFADFAVWQEQWLASDEPAQSLEFWRKSLGNDFSRLTLTRDDDAEAEFGNHPESTGDIQTLQIPGDLQAKAHAFCKRENVTLNILLFSIFAALLHRLTGQDDLTIGSPCANRTEDTEELIGLFMNIQVMRLRLQEGATFRALLQQVQTWTLGAYENQALPFENLVHDPFFANGSNAFEIPVFFLYQKSFMVTYHIGQLEIVPLRSESPGAVFEMMFAIVDRLEDGPRLQLEYNPHSFKVATVQRYLRMFNELLQSALLNPNARIDELNLLSPSDRHQLLSAWNQTDIDFGPFEAVSARFLALAQREPQRIALECGGVSWSNEQLAAYARSLAARLIAEGLQPGGLVGICVERSPEMVGAVLAVMLAGGAYVPLDPRHPRERLQMVLEDSGAQLLLALRDLGLNTSAKVLNLGRDLGAPRLASATWAGPATLSPTDLAYVIYTSGSTGKPKGVTIEHGALINLLLSMQREPGLTSADTLVAITTLAFDIAGLELLLPLITGARLVLATDAEVMDGRQLLTLLEHTKATVLQATPGAWRILIDAGWTNSLPLKALCGGEALPRELAEKLLDRASEVWNVYGPTETTIWSSATRVPRGTGSPRIGPPIANTQFYVLDQRRNPTPIGVTGELYIGGAGLARGYWNRPELTKEKFIPNPFGQGRIYATGDLARIHADGSIELLGRADFQVKIRGYRIELAEIEAAIASHPRVLEAVVTAHKFETGTTRLVAYVVGAVDTAELPGFLGHTLPEFMVPAGFVVLPQLPRTANGKLDRKSLPDLSGSAAEAVRPFVPASTPEQKQLSRIWADVLDLSQVSINDSIFELGADSLLIFRIAARAQRENLPVNATLIFQQRTIAGVCAALEQIAQPAVKPTRLTSRIAAVARESYRLTNQKVNQ
jgi:amino acid adenylation domain-containing protein